MKIVFQNVIVLFFFITYNYLCLAKDGWYPKFTIGALFDESNPQAELPLKSVIRQNNMMGLFKTDFVSNIQTVSKIDSFSTSKILCNMTEQNDGIVGVFGPQSLTTSAIVQSICSNMQIPHIQTNWKHSATYTKDETVVNFYPDPDLLAQGLGAIVKNLQWNNFVILYENDDGLIRLQEVLKLQDYDENNKFSTITVKQLGNGPDYRTLLKGIKNSTITQIVLDCETDHILNILHQAKEVNLLDMFHNYFLTSLDAHIVDFSSLNTSANITTIRIFDHNTTNFQSAVDSWKVNEEYVKGKTLELTSSMITTESALMYDAATMFIDAFNSIHEIQKTRPKSMKCSDNFVDNIKEKWEDGYQIASFLRRKETPKNALTGPIKFDPETGKRNDFLIYIVRATSGKITATWSPQRPNDINITLSTSEQKNLELESLQKGDVIVASRIGAPYLMEVKNNSSEPLKGNARYEGYSMDLIHEISKELNFTYEFRIVKDYGKYDPITKQWNGLIRELLDHRAHLAICDLTITHQRREAVDFSMPFMTLGISILYKKELEKDVNMFAFLDPFSIDVWIYTATLYLTVSVILVFISRMAPGDWENPHPCNQNPEELENIWDTKNCLWLTLGSIMTQGCDILPKGTSSRMATSMWWFFSLIMTSSYTANLAAFLTMERMEPSIDSVEALAKQTKIKYGTVAGGATESFFRESNYSIYQRMWTNMISNKPSVFEDSNLNGVKRVRTTRNALYAFLMESSTIEYEIETKCDLKQVGTWLDSKGYGIAMPINSAYRSSINKAVLSLQENGTLQRLKNRWWKEKRAEPSCSEQERTETNSAELALANVGGVFLVLGIGIAIAFFLAILEFLWNIRNVSVEEHLSYWEALKVELLFAVNIWVTKKKTKPQVSESSSSNGDSKSLGRSIIKGTGSFLNISSVLGKMGTPKED